ncbi:MAG: hypothetical protein Q7J73_09415 [Dehalococcoidales bacterium]|nr:hypothetical protein [Dehalococcoidales bacterium]
MKSFKALAVLFSLVALISTYGLVHGAEVSSQQDQVAIFNDVTNRLLKDGIPIASSQIVNDSMWSPSLVAEYTLQSKSQNNIVDPDDPIYSNIVGREVNLAVRRGLNAGAYRIILININGKVISNVTLAVIKDLEWPNSVGNTVTLKTDEISAFVADFPSFGVNRSFSIYVNREGLIKVKFDLQAQDIQAANSSIPNIIQETTSRIFQLNKEKGANIAIFQIRLKDNSTGRLLLNYIRDLQTGSSNSWQIDGLTEDWYPHPSPAPQ